MIPRVYAPDANAVGETIALDADEAGHLVRVRRLGAGAEVRVFDGRGHEWHGTIRTAGKASVTVSLDAVSTPVSEARIACTVALAALKADGMDEAVRDVVMLGAAEVRPFVAARSETSLAALDRGRRTERWARIAVASAKQSGRAVVPTVHGPVSFDALIGGTTGLRLLLVEPGCGEAVAIADVAAPAAVTLAIGPEGGWTAAEVAAARAAGWIAVRLGGRILRAETAPAVAMAACQAVWRDD
ncbi:MAG: RsmE family RNA methyltransferase [Vicinamibacterales bacterium]